MALLSSRRLDFTGPLAVSYLLCLVELHMLRVFGQGGREEPRAVRAS